MTEPAEQNEKTRALPFGWSMTEPAFTGWMVLVVLMVLVLVEYVVAIHMDRNLPLMVIMNITDAILIMYYFMHVTKLWRRREEE